MTGRFFTALPLGISVLLATPAMAQTVTVAINADIRSSDPGVNRDDNTDGVILHVVEGLVGYAEDGPRRTAPGESGRRIGRRARPTTFPCGKGVKFHNGAKMTSADVSVELEPLYGSDDGMALPARIRRAQRPQGRIR